MRVPLLAKYAGELSVMSAAVAAGPTARSAHDARRSATSVTVHVTGPRRSWPCLSRHC
jgi:hypothetical protein